MKKITSLILGISFGFVLTRTEATSFDRIFNMFTFEEFHMFGILGSAVFVSGLFLLLIKKIQMKSITGEDIIVAPKNLNPGTWIGAIMFGIGWAVTGSCPGTIFAQIGEGKLLAISTFIGALAGVLILNFKYNTLRKLLKE